MRDSHAALGFIETVGLAAAIEAADAACKTANVKLVGRENSKGNGMITIKIKGDVSAVKSALLSAHAAASKVNKVVSVSIIPRPGAGLEPVMVYNKETELDESPTCVEEEKKQKAQPKEEQRTTELPESSTEAEEEKKQKAKPQEGAEKEQKAAEPSKADKKEKKEAKKEPPTEDAEDKKPAGKGTKGRAKRKPKKQ
ncbi:BMC domain-containing protein [Thermovirga lienii]|uniref:BMC domain-containing protein n=1 Tax=Thermovirga lienii TaxID=336261 RepID=UPI002FE19093